MLKTLRICIKFVRSFLCFLIHIKLPSSMAYLRAGILINTQYRGHSKVGIISFYCRWVLHADQHAAFINPFLKRCHKSSIFPCISATPCRSCTSGIDYNVHILQSPVLYIIKINEGNIHRKSGKSLINVNQGMHVGLMEMSGETPGTKLSPAVKNSDLTWQSIYSTVCVHCLYLTEFLHKLFDIILEIRKTLCQMQVSAKTEAVYRLAKQRSSDTDPVIFCVKSWISTLHKGWCSAKSYREKIRMQTQLVSFYLCICAKSRLIS